jgi:hypothetical protein
LNEVASLICDFCLLKRGAAMSKRERAEKPKGEPEQAKVVKTKEPEECASIRDVGAFVAELTGLAGPDLLLAIRKVRRLGANAVFFFFFSICANATAVSTRCLCRL